MMGSVPVSQDLAEKKKQKQKPKAILAHLNLKGLNTMK